MSNSIFTKIDDAFNVCDNYLSQMIDIDTNELQVFLTRSLTILIVSEYEEYLEKLFNDRAKSCGDICVANYIQKMLHQKFRSPDLSKINDILKSFHAKYFDKFSENYINTPAHQSWDSLLKARHSIVHKKGELQITYKELKMIYQDTQSILDGIKEVLATSL